RDWSSDVCSSDLCPVSTWECCCDLAFSGCWKDTLDVGASVKFLSQTDFSQIPVKGLVPESGATPPPNPTPGQLWVDTSTNPRVVKFWDGTKWVRADGADLPDGSITDRSEEHTSEL